MALSHHSSPSASLKLNMPFLGFFFFLSAGAPDPPVPSLPSVAPFPPLPSATSSSTPNPTNFRLADEPCGFGMIGLVEVLDDVAVAPFLLDTMVDAGGGETDGRPLAGRSA